MDFGSEFKSRIPLNSASRSLSKPYGGARSSVPNKKPNANLFFTPSSNSINLTNSTTASKSTRRGTIGNGLDERLVDSRPLTDLKYQHRVAVKVIGFLSKYGFTEPLPERFFKSPSRQDVRKVFEFLFSFFFQGSLEWKSIEVTLPETMARLKYPFKINKSMLQSFTGQKNIGTLHGMLEWLVDFIEYMNNFQPSIKINAGFDKENIYSSDNQMQLTNIFNGEGEQGIKKILRHKYGCEEELTEYAKQLKSLKEHLSRLEEEEGDLRKIPETIEAYSSDIPKLREFVEDTQELIENEKIIIDEIEADIKSFREKLRLMDTKEAELDSRIASQKVDRAAISAAIKLLKQLSAECEEEDKKMKQVKEYRGEKDVAIGQVLFEFGKQASEIVSHYEQLRSKYDGPYNKATNTPFLDYLNKDEWNPVLDKLKNWANSFVSDEEDFSGTLENLGSLLTGFQDLLTRTSAQLDEEIISDNRKIISLQEARQEVVEKIKILEADYDRNQRDLKTLKAETEAKILDLCNEVENLSVKLEAAQKLHKMDEEKEEIVNARKSLEDERKALNILEQDFVQKMKQILEDDRKDANNFHDCLLNAIAHQKRLNENLKAQVSIEKSLALRMRRKVKSKKLKQEVDKESDEKEEDKEELVETNLNNTFFTQESNCVAESTQTRMIEVTTQLMQIVDTVSEITDRTQS